MNRQQERLIYLFERYKNTTCSPVERRELMQLVQMQEMEQFFKELIQQEAEQIDAGFVALTKEQENEHADLLFEKIIAAPVIPMKAYGAKSIWWRWTAAAAVLLLVVLGWWLLNQQKQTVLQKQIAVQQHTGDDIQPGNNGASLILADGTKMLLDSAGNGLLAQQGNTKLVKLSNGQLAYKANGISDEILYNTLVTAKGKTFHVTLPDGTEVWLNAASSLHYPTAFSGKERRVEVTGEAYFEVAKNMNMPFKVNVNNMQEVEVLGTHFNINAYEDEAYIKTTLLEGSVRVSANNKRNMLTPGQQAQSNKAGAFQISNNVNLTAVTAWKNGYFQFEQADVQTVMHQLARWYNVDVGYQGSITSELFGGKIERNLTLLQVLKVLESTGLHCELKGSKLIVKQ